MAKYRKKPIVIDAVQWTGENAIEILSFIDPKQFNYIVSNNTLIIETLEGNHKASVGDWIIKGVSGEFYPCKPDIFEKTYEPA